MTALRMLNERTGASWHVWPEQESLPPGTVEETGSYLFELYDSTGADQADLLIDEVRLEALRSPAPRTARWRWQPGFNAGLVEGELRLPGSAARRFEVTTDPDRRKLTRDDFDTMVREILDDTFALFSLGSFRKSVARGAGGRPPAIARLEFLRSRIGELADTVAAISRNPRRVLTASEVSLGYHRARQATGLEVLRSFRSGRVLHEQAVGPSRLPAPLKGLLPEKIRVRRRQTSFDLPEHRQMAACLRSWSGWMTAAAGMLERTAKEDRQTAVWAARCRRLSRELNQMGETPALAEAGLAPPKLVLSALFRNDPAYRHFYRLWQDINAGIAAVFGDFLNLPLARTFELYELWCFLRLVRASAETFGPEGINVGDLFVKDASGSVTLMAGAVSVPVGQGWKLCFQKQYREFWNESDGRGSFSRIMVPDVVLARDGDQTGGDRLIVLDAKYRIDEGLKDALGSIHTYRDALVREAETGKVEGIVNAAYLLTPSIPGLQANYRNTPMPARLFHPDYRAGFQFGAVTLRPGMSIGEITDILRLVVAENTGAGRAS